MNNKIVEFLKKYGAKYPDYIQEDFKEKIYKGYTKNNDVINQIYVYLTIVDFKTTDYYSFIELMNKYFVLDNNEIIEMGCGSIPVLSSRIKKMYPKSKIHCLDKNIIVKEFDDIEIIEAEFNSNIIIDKYNLFYGFRPCTLTEELIKLCLQNKKEFIIYLCNCALIPNENYDKYNKNNWTSKDWHDYIFYVANKYNLGNFAIIREKLNNSFDDCPVIIGKLK